MSVEGYAVSVIQPDVSAPVASEQRRGAGLDDLRERDSA